MIVETTAKKIFKNTPITFTTFFAKALAFLLLIAYNIYKAISHYFLGGAIMATSSIFASFNIKDRKTAEAFAEALDQSANESKRVPTSPAPSIITDRDKILELLVQRKKLNE